MQKHNDTKLYNFLLPIWLIVFWPSWLWLFLIPANYLLDRVVLSWSLGGMADKGAFCRRHAWKICLAGFFSDLVGAVVLFVIEFFTAENFSDDFLYAVSFNPFSHIGAFFLVALAVVIAGALIYLIDRKILTKAGLDPEQTKKSTLRLALITAPYLYFFPIGLLYISGIIG